MEPEQMDIDEPISTKELQRRLMKKHNIVFDGPLTTNCDTIHPEHCRTIFQHIKQLGRTTYEDPQGNISADFRHHPWRHEVRQRAHRIAYIANRCINTRQNESGWRLNMEHHIMARFSVEVACKLCRGRLWRSEKEVIIDDPDSQAAKLLKDRQNKRRACQCDPVSPSDNIYDHGISALFDNKVDETIKYPKELQKELPKRDRPDRIYGLRVTERFDQILSLISEYRLRTSPFKMEGDALIFPYLVLEAKSEKSADGFADIEVQTAFAIRELLRIQDDLAKAVDEPSSWDGGPLVWFLSCKGEQWRVFAAYIERQNSRELYRVVRLWNGSVDDRDDALQLLLILDYIVDWARDIYREAVAQSLHKLVKGDSSSFACDPDIFSSAGNTVQRDIQVLNAHSGPSKTMNSYDPLRFFSTQKGDFRDARFIRTKFRAVYLTSYNLTEFIDSFESDEEAQESIHLLVDSLRGCCRVKRHMLDSLEAMWTDTERYGSDMVPPDEDFLAVFFAVSYLNHDWEQTRELGYLAITESLIDTVVLISGCQGRYSNIRYETPTVRSMPSFQDLLNRGIADTLSACASRECIYTGEIDPCSRGIWTPISMQNASMGNNIPRRVVLKKGQAPHARTVVYMLYSEHKVGRNTPKASFLRLSSQTDELHPQKTIPLQPTARPTTVWTSVNRIARLYTEDVIFAQCADCNESGQQPEICVFIMDREILKDGLCAEKLRCPEWYLNIRKGGGCHWNRSRVDTTFPPLLTTNVDKMLDDLQQARPGICGIYGPPAVADVLKGSATDTLWDILTKKGITYPRSVQPAISSNMLFTRLNRPDTDDVSAIITRFKCLSKHRWLRNRIVDGDHEDVDASSSSDNSVSDLSIEEGHSSETESSREKRGDLGTLIQ